MRYRVEYRVKPRPRPWGLLRWHRSREAAEQTLKRQHGGWLARRYEFRIVEEGVGEGEQDG